MADQTSVACICPNFNHASFSVPFQQSVSTKTNSFYGLSKAEDFMILSKVDNVASAGVTMDSSSGKSLSVSQADVKKSPVSRPSRHRGPPPGFSHVSPRLDWQSLCRLDNATHKASAGGILVEKT